MKIKSLLTLFLLLIIFSSQAYCLDFKNQFNELLSAKDTVEMTKLLVDWEKSNPDDAELYVAYFNYYVLKSMKNLIHIGDKPEGELYLAISDEDSTNDEPVGYIYEEVVYEPELLDISFNYIKKGIEKFPSRLDMRFGKVYMHGEAKDYEEFTKEIIKIIDYSVQINNEWLWSDNKPVEDPKEFLFNGIQDYIIQLFNTEDDSLLNYVEQISKKVLSFYPSNIENLSNLSIVYLLREEYDKALEILLKSEKIAPEDYVILNNIGLIYYNKGDKENAIKYYEKAMLYGNEEVKKDLEEKIRRIKEEK